MLNFELSTTQQIAVLALQLGVIIFAAKFCGDLIQKLKMPSVLGEIAAGVLIGPYVLGAIPLPLHGLEHGLFGFVSNLGTFQPVEGAAVALNNVTFSAYHSSLYAIATIGSVLLLFISGLETDLRMFFRYSVVGTLVGIGGVIFSYLFGAGLGMIMLKTSFMDPRCMFLGILCTATSVGITARILSEKKKVDSPEGVTILAAAVIDDVLGIICLAIVLGLTSAMAAGGEAVAWGKIGLIALKCVGIWLGATVIGLLVARPIAKFLHIFRSPAVFAVLAFGLSLLLAGLFEQSGLAMIIGAYVMGLSLSKTDISFAIQHALHPVYNFMVPIFFVVMGMLIDIRVFANMDVLKMGLLYSLLAILAKILGCAIPALFMNFNVRGALRIGIGMIPRGEVALIIASIGASTIMILNGKQIPILNSELFGVVIIMTLATTVVAPPLLAAVLNDKKGVRKETQDMTIVHTPFHFPSAFISDIVMQRMIEIFEQEEYMLSTVDKSSGIIQIRKDDLSFALMREDNDFVFESNPSEVPFIHAIMYETFVDLHQTMGKLKDLSSPAQAQKEIFNATAAVATEQQAIADKNNKVACSIMEKALCKDAIIMKLKATEKDEVIKEMLDKLAANSKTIINKDQCYEDILEREKIITTCMQNGIAIPHARTEGASDIVAAIGLNPNGFNFDSMDKKPTKIFILCLSSKDSSGPHIEFIAAAASLLAKAEDAEALLKSKTVDDVYAFFTKKTQKKGA